jgi:guanosine-3',5'-bis(diphosphate) 3'-pyrophosphohydrolase
MRAAAKPCHGSDKRHRHECHHRRAAPRFYLDQNISAEMIANEFGNCEHYLEVTDDKSVPKAERKLMQIRSAPNKSGAAKMVKPADKISNVRTVTNTPAVGWTVQRRLEYIDWAKQVVAGLRRTSPWLEQTV